VAEKRIGDESVSLARVLQFMGMCCSLADTAATGKPRTAAPSDGSGFAASEKIDQCDFELLACFFSWLRLNDHGRQLSCIFPQR
jgi:hypothetical protein